MSPEIPTDIKAELIQWSLHGYELDWRAFWCATHQQWYIIYDHHFPFFSVNNKCEGCLNEHNEKGC